MIPIRRFFRHTLITGAALGLCAMTAFAEEGFIPYKAAVSAESAVIYEEADTDSSELATLSTGDVVVLLSNEQSGMQPAAWEDGDDVVTGYVDVSALEPESVGEATLLNESANLHHEADSDSEVKDELSQSTQVQILGYNDSWYFVKAGDQTGFISVEELNSDVVTSSRLNLRIEPNTDCDVITVLPRNTVISPEESGDGWIKVTFEGQTGYISSEYVDATEDNVVQDPSMSTGEAVVAFAAQFEGNPYVWGGTSLTRGCDCSGFVMKVYEHFGVSLPHSSGSIRHCGYAVSRSEMQPGDVVCYSGHVGIYAGDGKIINALNSRVGIVYSNVDVMRVVGIRRML